MIEEQGEKQTKTIEKQGEKQIKAIKNRSEQSFQAQIKNLLPLCFQKIF